MQKTNDFKLGLFVLLAIAATLAATVIFASRLLSRDTVSYYTYFNESVQGLEVGAPVKFRGVTIGSVTRIEVAPDHRMVEVKSTLDVHDVVHMGLSIDGEKGKKRFLVPEDLRAQLGSQGITGVKFVAIDFFDTRANPMPELAFQPPDNYIPAAASLMKNLEDTIGHAMEKLPELVDATVAILGRIDHMAQDLEDGHITDKAVATMGHADDVLNSLHGTLEKLDKQRLPEKAGVTIDDLHVAIAKMNKVLDRVDGETGLVATASRSIGSVGDLGRDARGTARDLDETLRDVSEAAQSIKNLTDALEKDPDMLIKGHTKEKR